MDANGVLSAVYDADSQALRVTETSVVVAPAATGVAATDTPALQAAVDSVAAGGGSVFIRKGDYYLDESITVNRSNIRIYGEPGTRLVADAGDLAGMIKPGEGTNRYENIIIEGIAFYDPDPVAHTGAQEESHGIVMSKIDGGIVRNCRFIDLGDEAVDVQRSTNVHISYCYADGTPAVGTSGCFSINHSSGCSITYCYDAGALLGQGFRVETPSGNADACANNTVAFNYSENRTKTAIGVVSSAAAISHVNIIGNIIKGCLEQAIKLTRSAESIDYITVADNHISGGGTAIASSGGAIEAVSSSITKLMIARNTIEGFGNADNQHAIRAAATDCFIVNNIIVTAADDGIRCDSVGGATIAGNIIKGCGVTSGNGAGIFCLVSSDGNEIRDNVLDGNRTNLTFQSGSDNHRVVNNVFKNATSTNLSNSGTGNVFARNAGYVTEATGATSVADGGTITHGLSATPTKVRCTPSTSGEFVAVTALGATTFTVAIKKHDGTAGTTAVVYWEAEV